MELLAQFWDVVLHLDRHLEVLLLQYGPWIYGLLFLIIFCETGLVIAPFLPGDSLLFVAGALWANAGMDAPLLAACLISAAVLGDNCNYFIGRWLGPRVFRWENSRLFNQRALVYTQQFYERHGGKTVMMARWLPLVRTFAPFVAGVGRMHYARFVSFSVIGSIVWVGVLVALGWYEYREIIRSDLERAELQARVLEDHATRSFGSVSVLMTLLDSQLNPSSLSQAPEKTDAILTQALAALPSVRSLSVLNTNGYVLASSEPGQAGSQVALAQLGPLPAAGKESIGSYVGGRKLPLLVETGGKPAAGWGS